MFYRDLLQDFPMNLSSLNCSAKQLNHFWKKAAFQLPFSFFCRGFLSRTSQRYILPKQQRKASLYLLGLLHSEKRRFRYSFPLSHGCAVSSVWLHVGAADCGYDFFGGSALVLSKDSEKYAYCEDMTGRCYCFNWYVFESVLSLNIYFFKERSGKREKTNWIEKQSKRELSGEKL